MSVGIHSFAFARRASARLIGVALMVGVVSVAGPAQGASRSPEKQWVEGTLARMTLEEKVGQLFVVSAAGVSVRDDNPDTVKLNQDNYDVDNFEGLIEKYHLGGIVYFGTNLRDPDQIVGLSNGIQQVATSQRVPVPALISTDQEGGTVQLIRSPAAVFPGNMALGAIGDSDLAEESASVMGQELRAMGVNTDLAPVVDVNINPLNEADASRSYSDRTAVVTSLGEHQVRGFQEKGTRGVAATVKHFPGLGSATKSTDDGPAVSDRTLAELRSIDLPPFRKAIKAADAMQVMTSFLTLPKVDPSGVPSAFSSTIVTGLLRKELNFKGVVITDALQAKAVKALNKSPAEIAVMAINAGNDQLLEQAPGDHSRADLDGAFHGIIDAVKAGTISGTRIDDSVRRVFHEKWALGLVKDPYEDPEDVGRVVGTESHLELAEQASADSITMLKNNNKVLPLHPPSRRRVLVTGYQTSTLPCVDTVAQALATRHPATAAFPAGFSPDQNTIDAAVAKAKDSDLVIVLTYNPWRAGREPNLNLVRALVGTGKPVVAIALGAPYDIAYFGDVAAFLAVYNYYTTSLDAAVDAIFEDVNPSGKLPITITQPPPSTTVVYPFASGLHYPD
jgi:beta-N-acetylhexosaminidase